MELKVYDNFRKTKSVQKWLEVIINGGIAKNDAIRILKKIIVEIGKAQTYWYKEANTFVALLKEKTDFDDGIHLSKKVAPKQFRNK